jgi:hypothetical protein
LLLNVAAARKAHRCSLLVFMARTAAHFLIKLRSYINYFLRAKRIAT